MKHIKFKKSDYHYSVDSASLETLYILGFYLTSDVGSRVSSWIDWINNSNYAYTSSNISFVDKENGKIYVGFLFSEEEDGGPYFETTKEQFIKMLEQWHELLKKQPNSIFLTIHDDGSIVLEGSMD